MEPLVHQTLLPITIRVFHRVNPIHEARFLACGARSGTSTVAVLRVAVAVARIVAVVPSVTSTHVAGAVTVRVDPRVEFVLEVG